MMVESKSFKVPYGVDETGLPIEPDQASKDMRYICPGCEVSLILRRGKVVRAHFSHPSTAHCSAETALHRAAKIAIKLAVETWVRSGMNRPVISNRCTLCHGTQDQFIPEKVKRAECETRLSSGHIADVVLTDGENVVLAIEILITHKVSMLKALAMPVHWVELDASSVLANPLHWKPTQSSLRKFVCKRCKVRLPQFEAECTALGKLCNVTIPSAGFIYGPTCCERCKRWCLVFLWNKEDFRSKIAPRTVKLIHGRDEYIGWSNTCAWCDNVIKLGDLRQRHCPFWFMKPEAASVNIRAKSQTRVALHYFDEVRPRAFDKVAPPRKLWMQEM